MARPRPGRGREFRRLPTGSTRGAARNDAVICPACGERPRGRLEVLLLRRRHGAGGGGAALKRGADGDAAP